MTLPKIGTQGSLTARTYEVLKEAIVSRQLQPNEPLNEEQLAEQLGVSRTPLRAALQKLAYEQLIKPFPGRGYMVASLSRRDMEHVFFMRKLLEPEAARLAAARRAERDADVLHNLVSLQKRSLQEGRYLQFLSHDREFHLSVAGISQNPYLRAALATVQLHGHRFLVLDQTVHARSTASVDEHALLAQAIADGEPQRAAKLALEHVRRTEEMLSGVLRNG